MKRLLSRDYSRKMGAGNRLQQWGAGFASFARFAPIALIGFMLPSALFGQKTNDLIIALQRDMSSLQEDMKNLQKGQDEKLAAIQTMLQQAVDASKGLSTSMANLQHEVDTKLNDQQGKLTAPVATLGTKVDQMSDEFRAVATTVADLAQRLNAQDAKLKDISDAIRTLAAAAPAQGAPPPAVPAAAPAAPDPCAGMSAESLWENARRDKNTGKLEIAMTEYKNYVSCFGDTANAPVAQYEIGMMYFNNGQSDPKYYEDAAKAFDDGVQRFPENPKTPEALYYNAVSLMKADHRTEAGTVFKEYLKRYPQGTHVAGAHQNLKTLGLDSPTRRRQH
jgi:TolA-binding protein